MTAHVGDEIMIMSQMLHRSVREGEIREVRDVPGSVVYLVRWDTGHESLLWPARTGRGDQAPARMQGILTTSR